MVRAKDQAMIPQVDADDRTWAIYANATGLLVLTNIPFANVLAAALVWVRVRKNPETPFARAHAAAVLNFQVTWTVFTFAFVALLIVLSLNGRGSTMLPTIVIAYIALALLNVLLSVMGCSRASDLKGYRYPLSVTLVR